MGGLNTSLLIGTQALETTQGALDATSNNIANSNTPGYTREIPQLAESPLELAGNEVIGGGVSLTGLQSVRDELLNLQIQNQTSLQSSADTQSSLLQQIQTYFTTTGGDISSALSAFSSSLAQLSANQSSSARPAGSTFERSESGAGLQYDSERPHQRAVGCGFSSDADRGADQLADKSDCAA